MMRKILFLVPLAVFLLLVIVFSLRLNTEEASVKPHLLVGKTLPDFTLVSLTDNQTPLASNKFKGPALINLFASWCVPCQAEQPLLMKIAKEKGVIMYGINWRDTPVAAKAWLNKQGNPYKIVGQDMDGSAALTLGITGVPETFVINEQGIITHHIAGPITEKDLQALLPIVEKQ